LARQPVSGVQPWTRQTGPVWLLSRVAVAVAAVWVTSVLVAVWVWVWVRVVPLAAMVACMAQQRWHPPLLALATASLTPSPPRHHWHHQVQQARSQEPVAATVAAT